MLRYHRWCSPWNFLRLFWAAHFRKRNAICRIALRGIEHPVFVRARTSDCTLVRSVLIREGGEYPVFENYRPQVILDAGANIGLATVFFKMYYPDSTVVAIEPDDANCEMFQLNTRGLDKVHLLHGGLWPDAGQSLRIKNRGAAPWLFQCEPADAGVPTFTIADICARFSFSRIDILKIDIEGNERELFSRNTDWLDMTYNMFVELHDHLSPGASQCLINAIAGRGFSIGFSGENLVLTKNGLQRLDKWISPYHGERSPPHVYLQLSARE
jgi:FkbM family methyltransferase